MRKDRIKTFKLYKNRENVEKIKENGKILRSTKNRINTQSHVNIFCGFI